MDESLVTLLEQYGKLCAYCDRFFESVMKAYPGEIQCRKGCSECCTLTSVCQLEAFVIARYLRGIPRVPAEYKDGWCRFLSEENCLIYPVRPLICRTHGLPLDYPDQEGVDICPKNFKDRQWFTIQPESILKAQSITENLMRLNMAYCMIINRPAAARDRVVLWDIEPEQDA